MILIVKHIDVEGPGLIEDFFASSGYKLKEIDISSAQAFPRSLKGLEGVVLLGGPMNVHEEEKFPFLKEEGRFIQKIIKKEIPTLGICLGAQLIAKALGAGVEKASEKEIGWHTVRLTDNGMRDKLFMASSEYMEVFQWHEDKFEVPKNAELLAESRVCPQGFRFGRCIYGLQFHFEVTPYMIKEWINKYPESAPNEPGEREYMLIKSYESAQRAREKAYEILLNFSRLICGDKAAVNA